MKTKEKKIRIIVLLVVMVLILTTTLFYGSLNPFIINKLKTDFSLVSSKNNLAVHFISVGQGDAIAITFPDETILLIDTGPATSATTYTNYIKTKILGNKTNKVIDYLVLTHADMDHCGGTNKLLDSFKVDEVVLPKVEGTSNGYQTTLSNIKKNGKYTTISEDFSLDIKGCKLTCFGPLDYDSTNDTCPLIKIEYKSKSFLFTGDLSSTLETDFINLYGDELDSDVLKVGHHGSKSSTSEEFLQVVTPDYSVISVGKNSYGHPNEETIERLNSAKTTILRTDEKGDVLFVVGDNYGLSVLTGEYHITSLSLNYVYVVIILEIGFACMIVVILTSKTKKQKRELRKKKIMKRKSDQ